MTVFEQHHVFGAEARRQRDVPAESLEREAHDILGRHRTSLPGKRRDQFLRHH
jgi:hypothetical protein